MSINIPLPADVLLSHGLFANEAVEEGVERLEKVVVSVDLVQIQRDCHHEKRSSFFRCRFSYKASENKL